MTAQDPFIGREILNGEFRIMEKIGTGGMGSVSEFTWDLVRHGPG